MTHTYVLDQALFSIGGDAWIEDEAGNRAFEVDGKAFAIRRTLEILDPSGASLYTINQSLAHVHRTFEIKQGGAVVATIQEALLTFLGDRFTIELATGDQLSIQGDWINREFHVTRDGTDVIFVSRSLISLHDRYGIQIADGFDIALGLAIVVALEQMELQGRTRR